MYFFFYLTTCCCDWCHTRTVLYFPIFLSTSPANFDPLSLIFAILLSIPTFFCLFRLIYSLFPCLFYSLFSSLLDPQLSKSNTEDWELRSIEQTMIDLNHFDSSISILKIDLEGAEWDALASFFSSKNVLERLSKGLVKQLLIEFHWDPDTRSLNQRHSKIMQKWVLTCCILEFCHWAVIGNILVFVHIFAY